MQAKLHLSLRDEEELHMHTLYDHLLYKVVRTACRFQTNTTHPLLSLHLQMLSGSSQKPIYTDGSCTCSLLQSPCVHQLVFLEL